MFLPQIYLKLKISSFLTKFSSTVFDTQIPEITEKIVVVGNTEIEWRRQYSSIV